MELSYPAGLPIVERREELLATIRDHQVVVVAGDTGSGKSTQLPKLCLELGRGAEGRMIGHTQPRRIAARAVAERVASELGTDLGDTVGYAVRFTDRVSDETRVKVMTDGILLAELPRDRKLRAYDTLIVDEAHERSLNIDFLLGYLTQLLPQRPDLKLIVTSATIDTERFARHFGDAPIVQVSGRTYPVEVRYRPLDPDDPDQTQSIVDACEELRREGPGDVLVFLSGEREIRDTADAFARLDLPGTEILALYARLSAGEQHRVFQPHRGRRIVLATNVAETSLTVPGIRYVVDAGTARISRYNRRTKVQRLPIEPISQASAQQRAGRCGRVAPGICIRLYDEDDFAARPEFTEPEILRTNLASVVLQMASIGLGSIETFPFVEPPDRRSIADGIALLEELGALEPGRGPVRLTPMGRTLARLPVDPRLGRMVVEADRNGSLREVLAIASFLAIQDPRERPADKQALANEAHNRFTAETDSDFVAVLRLWEHLRREQQARSSNQFRKLCKQEFLNHLRVREWQDVHSQLRRTASAQRMRWNDHPAPEDSVHQAVLAGLLSHLGHWDPEKREYAGARGARFEVGRGAAMKRRRPAWVMAAELVETNRLWARTVAPIQPEWAERLAGDLAKVSWSEAWWDERREAAMTDERVHLFGLPIVAARRLPVGRVDKALARDLFIEHALVRGEWDGAKRRFGQAVEAAMDEVRALERRVRRGDLLLTDSQLFDLWDARLGADVTSGRHFDTWWKRTPVAVAAEDFLDPEAPPVDVGGFPLTTVIDGVELAVSYVMDPADDRDGVTVDIPVDVLHRLDLSPLSWQVPGHRLALVTELLRALPKPVRRHLVPVPDHAAALLARSGPQDGWLVDVVAREATRVTGERVRPEDVDVDAVPAWLRTTYRAVDGRGRPVAWSKDPAALVARLEGRTRAALAAATKGVEQTGSTTWTFGTVEREVTRTIDGRELASHPALVDEGESVGVRVFATPADQARAMRLGTRRLVLLGLGATRRAIEKGLGSRAKLDLAGSGFASVAEQLDDVAAATVDALVEQAGGPAWDEAAFAALLKEVRGRFVPTAVAAAAKVAAVVAAVRAVEERLDALAKPALQDAVDDAWSHLARLVGPGWVTTAGLARLDDVARYVAALRRRLDKLAENPARDRRAMATARSLENELRGVPGARWMLEEHRVALFAQQLGTKGPTSEQKIRKALAGDDRASDPYAASWSSSQRLASRPPR